MKRIVLLLTSAAFAFFLAACSSTGTAFNPPGGRGVLDNQLVVGMETGGTSGVLDNYAPPYSGAPSVSNVATGEPWNMTTDSHGNVWVATGYAQYSGYYGVQEFTTPLTASSAPALTIPVSNGVSAATEGIAFDSSGDLWVATWGDNTIREFKPPLSSSSTPALSVTNGVLGPEGIAFDSHGNLWYCNTNTGAIEEFTPPFSSGSSPALSFNDGGALGDPQEVAFNAAGDMFVADAGTEKAYEFEPPFSSSTTASATLSGFTTVGSLTLDSSGDLWVTDKGTNSVDEFKPPFSNSSTAALTVTNAVTTPWGLTFAK